MRDQDRERAQIDASAWRTGLAQLSGDVPGETASARISRRLFLQLLGSSAALAGTACFDRTPRAIVPYVRDPQIGLPGLPLSYATSMELSGHAVGLLVQSREGRPIKIEGNPDHPASLGATGAYEQAALLDLYDPSRLQGVVRRGQPSDWRSFARELALAPGAGPVSARGSTRVLIEPTAGPLAHWLLDRIEERRPGARVHFDAPLESRSMAEASRAIFGAELESLFDLERATVVLAVDADFTGSMPFSLRYARDLAQRRSRSTPSGHSRLYTVESAPTVTGQLADHRLLRPVSAHAAVLGSVLREVATILGAPEALRSALGAGSAEQAPAEWTGAVARDLVAHAGACAVLAGPRLPIEAQAVALALNLLLRNRGSTLRLIPRALRDAATPERSLAALVDEMRAGEVETLVVLGGNPVYGAPADLGFEEALAAVPRSVYLGLHADETAERSHWVVPQRHFLESWGDARAFDGTASLIQPLIRPLYEGASPLELLALLAGESESPLDTKLRERWTAGSGGAPPVEWEAALERGVIEGTSASPVETPPSWEAIARLAARVAASPAPAAGALELSFRPDARVYDGRFAHNLWLQELPDPITKLTWDNAAWIAPETARELGIESGQWLRIRRSGRELVIPALVVAGCARSSVTLHLGYGRRAGVRFAQDVGFRASSLRTREALHVAVDAEVQSLAASGESRAAHPLAFTQQTFDLHGRDALIAQVRSVHDSPPGPAEHVEPPSLYGMTYQAPEQWAMAIDLSVCNGCSACVVACQAENNVPVVGKDGVLRGREMHWLRIDRYLTDGETDVPEPISQPMLCQHCESAPCEYVCPVYATTHSADGLNQMVYNRCIGTRFCSNNCPYKVRRFNWFDYTSGLSETQKMGLNPEVSVRERGVIEKCTFCVQRIRRAQIDARNEERPLRDGEVKTACQQACPTRAIHFGSQADPQSDVTRTLAAPHVYAALEQLHTRPRVRYLARLRNPNPALDGAGAQPRERE